MGPTQWKMSSPPERPQAETTPQPHLSPPENEIRRRRSFHDLLDTSEEFLRAPFDSAYHSLEHAKRTLKDATSNLKEKTEKLEHEIEHAFAESFLYVRRRYRHALKLYRFEDIPHYLQDNEFVRTGYRTAYSAKEAWLSVVHWHNETGNIWTHLVGLIFFIGILIGYQFFLPEHSDVWDYVIFALFILSACKCFLFSTLFHIHFCNNRKAFKTFGCLDYAGISLLIAGSTAIVTYYSFYCHALERRTWLAILLLISLVGLVGPMFKIWATPKFRVYRTGIYLTSGVVSASPVFQYLFQYGLPDLPSGIWGFFIMAACYIGGAVIYAFKIPERYLPGKFDFLFNSHQFWHVAVVSGAYLHYRSCMELVHWRLNQGSCNIMFPDLIAS